MPFTSPCHFSTHKQHPDDFLFLSKKKSFNTQFTHRNHVHMCVCAAPIDNRRATLYMLCSMIITTFDLDTTTSKVIYMQLSFFFFPPRSFFSCCCRESLMSIYFFQRGRYYYVKIVYLCVFFFLSFNTQKNLNCQFSICAELRRDDIVWNVMWSPR